MKYAAWFISLLLAPLAWAQMPSAPLSTTPLDKSLAVSAKAPHTTITLKSNPGSTGYSWFIEPINTAFVQIDNHQFIAPKQNLVGASGYEQWHITVLPSAFKTPTIIPLRFHYVQPWDVQQLNAPPQVIYIVTTP